MDNGCSGCEREKKDKNHPLCEHCKRRINYAKGEPLSPFPKYEDIKKIAKKHSDEFEALSDDVIIDNPDPKRKCLRCGGAISISNRSGYCRFCYSISGGVCKMGDCKHLISIRNKSGFCRECLKIITNRERLGIKDIYGSIKRRIRIS